MHDLHEADKILHLILLYAKKNRFKIVKKAVIELGSIVEHGSEIQPENITFNLKLLAKDTIAKQMEVEIRKIKGNTWVLKEIIGQ